MKKFAILSLTAVAALTLAACGSETTSNTSTTIENETVLNSEDAPVDNLAVEDPALGNAGDNVAVDSLNSSVENTTTTNTVQ